MSLRKLIKVADCLFKDVRLNDAVNPILLLVFIFLIKFIVVGVQEDLLETYFEILTSLLLLFILVILVPIKEEGYIGIVNIFVIMGGAIYVVAGTSYFLVEIAVRIYGFFVGLHMFYLITNLIFKPALRKRKIRIRKIRRLR